MSTSKFEKKWLPISPMDEPTDPPEGVKTYSYDYKLTKEVFWADSVLTPLRNRVIILLLTTLLVTVLLYWYSLLRFPDRVGLEFGMRLAFAATAGIGVTLTAMAGGYFWQKIGFKTGKIIAQVYHNPQTRFQKLFASIYFRFVETDNQIYLEGRSRDLRIEGLSSRFSLMLTTSLPLISFFILSNSLLIRPLISVLRGAVIDNTVINPIELELQVGGALLVTIILITLYLPASLVLDDANIRTWNPKAERIGTPLSTIRGYIDGLAGIGALLTGWGFYQEQLGTSGFVITSTFLGWSRDLIVVQLIDYVLMLGFILMVSWPFVVPTVMVYLANHAANVNQFRTFLIQQEIPLSIANIRAPTTEELAVVVSILDQENSDSAPSDGNEIAG